MFLLEFSAQDYVDSVPERPVPWRYREPRLPAHDDHILFTYHSFIHTYIYAHTYTHTLRLQPVCTVIQNKCTFGKVKDVKKVVEVLVYLLQKESWSSSESASTHYCKHKTMDIKTIHLNTKKKEIMSSNPPLPLRISALYLDYLHFPCCLWKILNTKDHKYFCHLKKKGQKKQKLRLTVTLQPCDEAAAKFC